MKVLWLISWYPTPLSPFSGDFIQRHARAVALHCEVEVIYVVKDAAGKITSTIHEEVSINGKLTERVIYYKPASTGIGFVDKYLSHKEYGSNYKKAIDQYITANGKPAFLHVHVSLKAGLIALWAKKRYDIPYILSEHWATFLPESIPNMDGFNAVYKKWWRQVFDGAYKITVVSKVLGEALLQKFAIKDFIVIPNVVDSSLFYPVPKRDNNIPSFIHISSLSYQKNPEHIIEAFALLKQKSIPFSLIIFGPENKELSDLVKSKGLNGNIHFNAEVAQLELAKEIQQSDALILYSRFETFGCVLIEANASGIPVIVSDIKVFHEIVEDGVNGVFVKGENPGILADKLALFIQQKENFNKQQIAAAAVDKYNYEKIGKQFVELYQQVLNKE